MIDKVQYWVELSDYDLETARAMLSSKRYLYVGFMCHQAIEKIMKAYYNSRNTDIAPYTHSLAYLSRKSNLVELLSEEQRSFLDVLEPLNIEARYPSHKEKVLKSLSEEKCHELIEKTKTLQQWIKTKL
ncbi:MAG: HEPN domain-containing protein [Ignavibacteriae bacterium]|nr:HEPN domain-containing protein [Ignavibacteriota bacterium]